MKRIVFLSAATIVWVSCESGSLPLLDPGTASYEIVDGANGTGGNPHFFFLPPLVPSPTLTGEFTGLAQPTIEIEALENAVPPFVGAVCPAGIVNTVVRTIPTDSIDVGDDHYQFNWKTGEPDITTLCDYRIRVSLLGRVVGWRDVDPKDSQTEVPSNPETEALYAFRNGSTIPIKFVAEEGFLCPALDVEEGGGCAEGPLSDGLTAFASGGSGGVDVPTGQQDGTYTGLIIEPCLDQSGNPVTNLPVDIPTFGPCFTVRTEPELSAPLSPLATVFVCEELEGGQLSHEIEELIRLHKTEALDGLSPVFALPNSDDLCPSAAASTVSTNPFIRLARRLVDPVLQIVRPAPLLARRLDRGRGGVTPAFSFFQFGLPTRMEILEGDDQFAQPGGSVPIAPAVRLSSPNWVFDDLTETWNETHDVPAAGATVHFEVVNNLGEVFPSTVVSDAGGVARVDFWQLGLDPTQVYELRAFGLGLASPDQNGPASNLTPPADDVFDAFVPAPQASVSLESPVALQTGEVIFSARICGNGFGSPDVSDRVLDDLWIACTDANTQKDFTANLSGGSSPAKFFVLNDDENIYFAVQVARDEADKVNVMRLEFDAGELPSNGLPTANDDVLELQGGEAGETVLGDIHLIKKCEKSGQSACGNPDLVQDIAGAWANSGGFSVYEISHPLCTRSQAGRSGDVEDFCLSAGDTVGVFLNLRLGKGAQGNTEFPDFRQYLVLTIQ